MHVYFHCHCHHLSYWSSMLLDLLHTRLYAQMVPWEFNIVTRHAIWTFLNMTLHNTMYITICTHQRTRVLWTQKMVSVVVVVKPLSTQWNADSSLTNVWKPSQSSNGSWCMGIKGEMSRTVCVILIWYSNRSPVFRSEVIGDVKQTR